MKLTLTQLLALAKTLGVIYADYQKIGRATPTQIATFTGRAIQALVEAGLTLADLSAILAEIGPLLPLLVRTAAQKP